MEFKKQIELTLNALKKLGLERRAIEKQLGYAEYYIDQVLSKGGNKKVLASLQQLVELKTAEESIAKNNMQFEEDAPTSYVKTRRNLKIQNEKPNTLMYYEIGAHAGTAHSAEILPVRKSEGVLRISDLFKGSEYAIRINGNSMIPSYPPGAIIGIREIPDKMIQPGSVYVVEKDSDLWIKRLFYKEERQDTGVFEMISDNGMVYENGPRKGKLCYPPFEIEIDKVRRLFKVTGLYKANELTVIN